VPRLPAPAMSASCECEASSIRLMGTEPFPLPPRHSGCYHAESVYPRREVKAEASSDDGSSSPSQRPAIMKPSDHYGLCLEVTGLYTIH
jgi:hypothetical protein